MISFSGVAASAKTAAATALATVASGLAQFLQLIPDDIGKLATLVGICLTIVMIGYWLEQKKKSRMEAEFFDEQKKKARLESEILAEQLKKLRSE